MEHKKKEIKFYEWAAQNKIWNYYALLGTANFLKGKASLNGQRNIKTRGSSSSRPDNNMQGYT